MIKKEITALVIKKKIIAQENQKSIGWRDVPVDPDKADVGPASRGAQPFIKQLLFRLKKVLVRKNLTESYF